METEKFIQSYSMPGTCINHQLHQGKLQHQGALPELSSYTDTCKIGWSYPNVATISPSSSIMDSFQTFLKISVPHPDLRNYDKNDGDEIEQEASHLQNSSKNFQKLSYQRENFSQNSYSYSRLTKYFLLNLFHAQFGKNEEFMKHSEIISIFNE